MTLEFRQALMAAVNALESMDASTGRDMAFTMYYRDRPIERIGEEQPRRVKSRTANIEELIEDVDRWHHTLNLLKVVVRRNGPLWEAVGLHSTAVEHERRRPGERWVCPKCGHAEFITLRAEEMILVLWDDEQQKTCECLVHEINSRHLACCRCRRIIGMADLVEEGEWLKAEYQKWGD